MDKNFSSPVVIGIDATNIRVGGGVTHLLELLGSINPQAMLVKKVYVWGGSQTLMRIANEDWIVKINPSSLDKGLFYRILWQIFSLSKAAQEVNCNVLFIPGGSYLGNFFPVVTMCQNLFPFEWRMMRRVGFSFRSLKFFLLRLIQSFTFLRSDGVIFLTQYSRNAVLRVTGSLPGKQAVIAHGLNPRFDYQPKNQLSIDSYGVDNPYRLLYVSTIDVYKNQLPLIRAIHMLRKKGYPLVLTLIGPNDSGALRSLQDEQKIVDPNSEWLEYLGALPYESLNLEYQKADLGIFASSCETFGMTVLEKMSVGLPIACSNESSMHEILGPAGLYFDPGNPADIAAVIEQYLLSPSLRDEMQSRAHKLALNYSWAQCADQTVNFLREVAYKNS